MKSRSLKLLTYGLGVGIVVAMVGYLYRQRDLFDTLKTLDLRSLVIVMALGAVTTFNYGGRFKIGSNVFGVPVSYWQALGLAATNTMLNYAIPLKGGMIMRAAYMKQRFELSYTDYGALLASSQLIAVAAGGLIGLAACAIALAATGVGSLLLVGAFTASIMASVVAYLIAEKADLSRFVSPRLGERLQAFSSGFTRWRSHPLAVAKFVGSLAVTVLATSIRLYVVFRAVGVQAPLALLLVIGAATSISSALSLTPGNLGIREAVIALSASMLSVDGRVALLVSLIDRAAGIVVMLAMGLGFSHTLTQRRRIGTKDPE